jgi:hypothetical protein
MIETSQPVKVGPEKERVLVVAGRLGGTKNAHAERRRLRTVR